MTEYVYLVLEYHIAKSSPAETRFLIPENHKLIYSEPYGRKTHFKKYYEVPKGSKVVGIRKSNRGNIRTREFTINDHTFIDFLLNVYPLNYFEVKRIELIKKMNR